MVLVPSRVGAVVEPVEIGVGGYFGSAAGFGGDLMFTIDSDCHLAREMLVRVATDAVGEYLAEAKASWEIISDNYQSANPPLEPAITLVVNGGSLEFGVSYVVDYEKRTAMKDKLFTRIVQEVANSNGRLEWAQSGVTVINQPPPPDALEPHPPTALGPTGRAAGSH